MIDVEELMPVCRSVHGAAIKFWKNLAKDRETDIYSLFIVAI
jgi:hypothetical protein